MRAYGTANPAIAVMLSIVNLASECAEMAAETLGAVASMSPRWALVALGLSPLSNFDRNPSNHVFSTFRALSERSQTAVAPRRAGKRGISPLGARRVRNGCYLLEKLGGKRRSTFATVTVPDLPVEQMRVIHEGWNKVVDTYRRKLTRLLKKEGLSGQLVSVYEVQAQRYDRSGIPVLHIHSVFVGRLRGGAWAVTPRQHDQIWRECLSIALGEDVGKLVAACNLQRVKKSAESYLGKYLTKGSKCVASLVANGFAGWLPKQWWGMTRSLLHEINRQTRDVRELADWLNYSAESQEKGVWLWHRTVTIVMRDGQEVPMATVGRLRPEVSESIHAYCEKKVKSDMNV